MYNCNLCFSASAVYPEIWKHLDMAEAHSINKDIYPSYELCKGKLSFFFRTVRDQKGSSEFLKRGSEVENGFGQIPLTGKQILLSLRGTLWQPMTSVQSQYLWPKKAKKGSFTQSCKKKENKKPKVKHDHPAGTCAWATIGFGKSSSSRSPMALRHSPQENHGF